SGPTPRWACSSTAVPILISRYRYRSPVPVPGFGGPMFKATYLAHHGWLISTPTTNLLVDPSLQDRFGFTDAVEIRMYPPRRFAWDKSPAIDAVFITHEHEGHFDPATLSTLDRRVPIYLSARSSFAISRALTEMGFETIRLANAGQRIAIGDLELLPITGD